MELAVYIVTAGLCIFWSIKLYDDWFSSARFDEGDVRRVFLLLIPATFFILILLTTSLESGSFRLDILVLTVYDAVILLSLLVIAIGKRYAGKRKGFILAFTVYIILSLTLVSGTVVLRRYPLLLMKITFYLSQIRSVSFLRSFLFSFEPESETDAMFSLLNKAVIAFFSYLPVTIVRFIYFRRSQQRLRVEIHELKKRIQTLESIVKHE